MIDEDNAGTGDVEFIRPIKDRRGAAEPLVAQSRLHQFIAGEHQQVVRQRQRRAGLPQLAVQRIGVGNNLGG